MGDYQMVYRRFPKTIQIGFMVLAILLILFVVASSLTSVQPSLHISNVDKVLHVLAYLVLGSVCLPAFARVQPLFVWLGLCVLGIAIEIAQGLMSTGRSADILDGFANASGAMLAVIAWMLLSKIVQKIA